VSVLVATSLLGEILRLEDGDSRHALEVGIVGGKQRNSVDPHAGHDQRVVCQKARCLPLLLSSPQNGLIHGRKSRLRASNLSVFRQ